MEGDKTKSSKVDLDTTNTESKGYKENQTPFDKLVNKTIENKLSQIEEEIPDLRSGERTSAFLDVKRYEERKRVGNKNYWPREDNGT